MVPKSLVTIRIRATGSQKKTAEVAASDTLSRSIINSYTICDR